MMKMSEITPTSVLLHSPYTLSTLDGKNITEEMVIKVPCFKGYFQRVSELVKVGELHQIGGTFYFLHRAPLTPRMQSLAITEDISYEKLVELSLPTREDTYADR